MRRTVWFALILVGLTGLVAAGPTAATQTENNTTKNILVFSDEHQGNIEGEDGSFDDIRNFTGWARNQDIHYAVSGGDITEKAEPRSFRNIFANYTNITDATPARKVWWGIGDHDGFANTPGGGNNFNNTDDRGINGLSWGPKSNQSSLMYTIEIGNTAFVFVPIYVEGDGSNRNWFISRNHLDHLKNELQHYKGSDYNVVVHHHDPINNTTQYTKPGDWAAMDDPQWQETSEHMRSILTNYSDVVEIMLTSHVHTDVDSIYSAQGTVASKVVNGSHNASLPDVTFIETGSIAWRHGRGDTTGDSNYPSAYLWNLTEGKSHITVTGYRTNTTNGTVVGVSHNKTGSASVSDSIDIQLEHQIRFPERVEQKNYLSGYRQHWMPVDSLDFNNASRENFYVQEEGFRVENSSYWFNSTWNPGPQQEAVPVSVSVNSSSGTFSHEWYAGEHGESSYEKIKFGEGGGKWLKVNTSVDSGTFPLYVYDYNVTYGIVFTDLDAELQSDTYHLSNPGFAPHVEVRRSMNITNFSRVPQTLYELPGSADNTTIGNLTVRDMSTSTNITPNTIGENESANFTVNTTTGNLTFKISGLNDSESYNVTRDGSIVVKNETPDNGTLTFHNDNWSTHTFAVAAAVSGSEDDTGGGLVVGDRCSSRELFGVCLTETILTSVGLGAALGVLVVVVVIRRKTL